jgi:hypothetical protein
VAARSLNTIVGMEVSCTKKCDIPVEFVSNGLMAVDDKGVLGCSTDPFEWSLLDSFGTVSSPLGTNPT